MRETTRKSPTVEGQLELNVIIPVGDAAVRPRPRKSARIRMRCPPTR